MVTAICFFDNVGRTFCETHRVLNDGGFLVVALIDRESDLRKLYQIHKQDDAFYKDATFYLVPEVEGLLMRAGFFGFSYKQIVFSTENVIHETRDGYRDGSFVVVKAMKQG